MPVKTVFSVCGMCPVRCPIEVDVENGDCRFIQGNRQVPSIRGALCTRGAAGIPFVRDDERPQFPMLRKGERGEGRWQRVSWEEALSYAAEKIAAVRSRHGGRSILWSDTGGPFSDLRQAFVRGLGSPNYFGEDSVHGVNRQHAALSLFGFTDERLALDLRNARVDEALFLDDRLEQLKTPVSLIWGESERLMPLAYAEQSRSRLPAARLEVLPRCGHVPQRECPEPTVAAIERALREPPVPRPKEH